MRHAKCRGNIGKPSTKALKKPVTAGIIRVSTKAQSDGQSPENQKQVLSQAGATRFFEAVESGFKAKREQTLKPLLEAIKPV